MVEFSARMARKNKTVAEILDRLEERYGRQEVYWPTEPEAFLIWWHCGYPQSDERCAKGWEALRKEVGTSLEEILRATPAKLRAALAAGGMVPELRAERMKQIAAKVKDECGGDLRDALQGPLQEARKRLKSFPNIADPGADRILLFSGIAPIAAVPSNCPHVLVRILEGAERENYGATFKAAQQTIEAAIPAKRDARERAYLLLKKHGQTFCKTKPLCAECILKNDCAFAAGKMRGSSPPRP